MLRNNRGYTITELIVVMGIFITVMVVTSSGFKTVLTQMGQQSKLMETDIGNVVGLEVFRSDLQSAGYGLPWAFQSDPAAANYTEVTDSDDTMPVTASFWETGKSPRTYNDAAAGNPGVPRAVISDDTAFNKSGTVGSKYLVIKSLTVLPSETSKKWLTVSYSESDRSRPSWGENEARDFDSSQTATERVMVVRNVFVDGIPTRQLQVNSSGGYVATFRNFTTLAQPHSSGDVFQVYGVDESSSIRMPFNRADYYVRRPDPPPPSCAPNTGVLYKAVLNQGSTGFTETPLMDCVADMQVVYGLGPVGSSEVNLHQPAPPATAKDIREQLKEIRVYILAHTGRKDTGYRYPSSEVAVGEVFGGGLVGRNFDLSDLIGPGWDNYRWKLYSIVVRPQNLIQ